MVLSIPSKSFLIGEYGVLKGGPALLLNTTPRFELRIKPKTHDTSSFEFHPSSPAGKLYEIYAQSLKAYNLEFYDPHGGKGGLGASSAQFALLYSFVRRHIGSPDAFEILKTRDELFLMLETYKRISVSAHGRSPSGYDVLSQMLGGVAFINSEERKCESLNWNLSGFSLIMIRTGLKVKTHEHLDSLANQEFAELAKIAGHAVVHFMAGRAEAFFESVGMFRAAMQRHGLLAKESHQLLEQFDKWPEVLAAKGCGALGADVIVLFCASEEKEKLREKLSSSFEIISDESGLTEGFAVDSDSNSVLQEAWL